MYHIYNYLHISERLLAQPILVLRYHPKTVCPLADALVYTSLASAEYQIR